MSTNPSPSPSTNPNTIMSTNPNPSTNTNTDPMSSSQKQKYVWKDYCLIQFFNTLSKTGEWKIIWLPIIFQFFHNLQILCMSENLDFIASYK